jgi:hypothetical protein
MQWPRNADGDVFRGLEADGFDFTKQCLIDFNVDFSGGTPSNEAVSVLRRYYPSATVYPKESDRPAYVLVQVYGHLDYNFVVGTQKMLTELMAPFGGSCTTWGVLA